MNCFNHPDQPAVAQCNQCGKFLCKECASKRTPVMCDECADLLQQSIQAEVQRKEKSENTVFIVSAVFFILQFFIVPGTLLSGNFAFLPFALISCILWGGAPFGWVGLNNLKDKMNVVFILPFIGWVIYFCVKCGISYFFGWIWMIKAIVRKVKNKKA